MRLTVDDQSLLASLQLAAQKWGAVQLNGSEAYKKRCMELALEHGIKVVNPEFGVMKREAEARRTRATSQEPPAVRPVTMPAERQPPPPQKGEIIAVKFGREEQDGVITDYDRVGRAIISWSGQVYRVDLTKVPYRILSAGEAETRTAARREQAAAQKQEKSQSQKQQQKTALER